MLCPTCEVENEPSQQNCGHCGATLNTSPQYQMMQKIADKEKKTASQLQAKSAAAGFAIGFIGFKVGLGILTGFNGGDGFNVLRFIGAIVVGGIGAAIGSEIAKPSARANSATKSEQHKAPSSASQAIDLSAYRVAAERNRPVIEESEICGCINCGDIFPPGDIRKWVDDNQTACCPRCGLAGSIVGSASGLTIDQALLDAAGAHRAR